MFHLQREHLMNRSRRTWLTTSLALTGMLLTHRFVSADDLPAKKPADRLSGPPEVSAKGWAIVEGESGKLLWGGNENEPLVLASTSKIMTAWLVLDLQTKVPDILEQKLVVSEKAAKTEGSSAKIETGDRIPIRELLYGLLLPSGNDAAAALAEHCGPHYRQEGDPEGAEETFVAQMNRQAEAWKLAQTNILIRMAWGRIRPVPRTSPQSPGRQCRTNISAGMCRRDNMNTK